jgi:hypothetical protein
MKQIVAGSFIGHTAAINIGLGFLPTYVKLWNLEDPNELEWLVNMADDLTADASEGAGGDDGAVVAVAATAGVSRYAGGDVISAAANTHKVQDPLPNKIDSGTGGAISTWTLDTVGNKTGHFDKPVSTTETGPGSIIVIDHGKGATVYRMTALTNDGDAADEVTLNLAAPSGIVTFVGGICNFRNAAAGITMPPGFTISVTGGCNVDGEMTSFIAGH